MLASHQGIQTCKKIVLVDISIFIGSSVLYWESNCLFWLKFQSSIFDLLYQCFLRVWLFIWSCFLQAEYIQYGFLMLSEIPKRDFSSNTNQYTYYWRKTTSFQLNKDFILTKKNPLKYKQRNWSYMTTKRYKMSFLFPRWHRQH